MVRIDDYQASVAHDPRSGAQSPIDLPRSNVLIYSTEDGTRVAARPSGTEPKIKFYVSVNAPLENVAGYPAVHAALEAKIDRILAELKLEA